jgi:hypothetical protein
LPIETPNERRLERERDEGGDRDAHPVALDVDAEDRDAVRPEPHQRTQVGSRRHEEERYRREAG